MNCQHKLEVYRIAANYSSVPSTVFFSQNLVNLFSDILTLLIYFLIVKMNNFRSDLSDIWPAKTAKLLVMSGTY